MEASTCISPSNFYTELAFYAHLVPAVILLITLIGVYVAAGGSEKSRRGKTSFLVFSLTFILWLVGDLVLWHAKDFDLIAAAWAPLDFINLLFFVGGAYYALTVARANIQGWLMAILALVPLPALLLTGFGKSLNGFAYAACEAIENTQLSAYRNWADLFVVMLLLALLIHAKRRLAPEYRKNFWLASVPTLAILAAFTSFETYSSISDNYNPYLYFLAITPIFFAPIVYLTIRYELNKLAAVGIGLLAALLVSISVLEFVLADNFSGQVVSAISLLLITLVSWLLLSTVRREAASRARAEELAKNLEVANLRLLELDKQKSEFVSLASHQLRGPITAVKGYASMVLEGDYGPVPKTIAEVLSRIQTSAGDMARLITDYLDVTRIELGRVKYSSERFSLRDLAQEVTRELMPNVPADKVAMSVHLGDEPLELQGDRNKIKQVVANFLDNAVKYTPQGTVTVTLSRHNQMARCEVSDTGLGISPESLPNLFQKFSRARNASKSVIRGTGLGLYIAKTIVDHHKGTLSAASPGEGKGSTFAFEVPLANSN